MGADLLRAGESCWQVASPHFPACACGESGGPGSPTTCEAQTKRQALASRAFDFHVAVGCRGGGGGAGEERNTWTKPPEPAVTSLWPLPVPLPLRLGPGHVVGLFPA